MPRALRKESQPWLRYIVLPLLLIFFGLEISYALLAAKKLVPPPSAVFVMPSLTPTPTPTPPEFTCPTSGWVNCMPILTEAAKRSCSAKALEWYKLNCQNFKGVAR